MKLSCSFLVWSIAATLALPAAALRANEFPVPPLHPTALFVDDNGKWAAVYAATSNGRAIVRDGEKKRTVAGNPRLRFVRVNRFAPGSVKLEDKEGGRPVYGEGAYLRQVATSDRLLTNCMAVMITIEPTRSELSPSATHIAIMEIDDLKPGKATDIIMSFPARSLLGMHAVLLIFSHGREIQTNQSDSAGAFFRKLDLENHRGVLSAYRQKFGLTGHPEEAYLRIQPILPTDISVSELPPAVHLSMLVNLEGTVEDLQLKDRLPTPVALAVLRAVGGWLYVPKMEHAYEVAVMKNVTIQLREPDETSPTVQQRSDQSNASP